MYEVRSNTGVPKATCTSVGEASLFSCGEGLRGAEIEARENQLTVQTEYPNLGKLRNTEHRLLRTTLRSLQPYATVSTSCTETHHERIL